MMIGAQAVSAGQLSSKRDRILPAALDVIRDRGVDGLTHRAVAQAAGISLGLTTYYFASLEDILEGAFDLAMQSDMAALSVWSENLATGADLPAELTKLVLAQIARDADSVYVNFVLVLAAIHRPQLQGKARSWANWLSELMRESLSPEAASAVATVYDGMLLRLAMTGDLTQHREIEMNFRRACQDESCWLGEENNPNPSGFGCSEG